MPKKRPVLIYGCGGHGQVVREILELSGRPRILWADDDLDLDEFDGVRVYHPGELDDLVGIEFVVAIGDCTARSHLGYGLQSLGLVPAAAIHPTALVSPRASVGPNCSVCARANIGPGATVERDCIINTGADIEHGTRIGHGSHVAPGAVLCGNVEVGPCCLIGAGAILLPGVHIPPACAIGAGAVITRSTRLVAGETVVGVPGRALAKT